MIENKKFWKPNYWHLGYIIGKITAIKKKLKKTKTPKEDLVLRLKREVLAIKKHIVFMDTIIQNYEQKD